MHWLKRDKWKTRIAIAGILLLLVLMVWVPVSAAGAYERVSGLATPVTGTVQATPTEDATVTALNKEKLAQEVQQLKTQNAPDLFGWLRTNLAVLLSTLVVVIGGLIGLFRWLGDRRDEQEKRREDQHSEQEKREEEQKRWLEDRKAERERQNEEQQRWLKDQEAEREKRAEERFQAAVEGLSSEREEAKVGAAIMLRTFLRPGYEQFYTQTFDLAVAHLRLPRASRPLEDDPDAFHAPPQMDPNAPLPLTTLSQALIAVFKEVFPLVRSLYPKGEQPLAARGIQLDNSYLEKADLEGIWMPQASLRNVDLCEANLNQAMLNQAYLIGAHLRRAHLREANLREAQLQRADLRGAVLYQADLTKADLREADLQGAECTGANFTGADLTNANLTGMSAAGATLTGAFLSDADLTRANLMKANLAEARLMKADFTEANLVEANLSGAYLIEVRLKETDLTRANLTNANLSQSHPEDAASLNGIKMDFVRGLTPDQLKDLAYHKAKWSMLEDIFASPDRPSSPPQKPQSQNDTTLFFPATSTQVGHSSLSSSSSQSNDVQTPSAPPAQVNIPPPETDGSSAASSKPDLEL